jgi:hypothetical protein
MKVGGRRVLEPRSPRWWALSIVLHIVLTAVLAQIIFRYPIGQIAGLRRPDAVRETIHYIEVVPVTSGGSGGARSATPSANASPAALQAPAEVPAAVPMPAPSDSARSQAAGGTGTGDAGDGIGPATGVAPSQPDSRIALSPRGIGRVERSPVEQVDSIVELVVGIVRDSLAIAEAQRKPGDWTKTDKNGRVWGWDPQGNIRLGKFTIPGALLAMLPLNMSGPMSPIEQRSLAYIRRDIMENAQRSINEDEFRAAVKRIRERKERERREGLLVGAQP